MKKRFIRLLCALLAVLTVLPAIPSPARADTLYLIPDSNTRRLTEAELWKWDRESLSYIFNEIFARYGYVFISGGKYDQWFRAMPWYKPNKNPDNTHQVYPKVTQLEWDNYHTIKKVAADMDAIGEKSHTKGRKCYTQFTPPGEWKLTGFSYIKLKTGQKLAVYSSPTANAWRGANGKASVSTNGAVWAAGWENGWLLVFYETNQGSVRVGYVNGSKLSGKVPNSTQLVFDKTKVQVNQACTMTDDPLKANTTMTKLKKGTTVLYLTTCINQNGRVWDYIQAVIGGKPARGYVPHECLNHPAETLPEIEY